MSSGIESVIVVMLENRSFDHMLGFLNHPSPNFDGLTGNESNPASEPEEPPVRVTATALRTLPLDPGHGHAEVMLQLTGKSTSRPPYAITNSGFVASYEGVGLREKKRRGFGPHIMKCQPPSNLPVLAELARSFAVCTRWFSSVPGQTWPNRNFAHAATSDGEVDNSLRLYKNETIFEHLGAKGRTWEIYHDGAAQSWAFRRLWLGAPGGGFSGHGKLFQAIEDGTLPNYAFVEPDHFWPSSSSQHPANNRKDGKDFARGEALVQQIYEALVARPDVFAKTLLIVTYDEHGGFYDHVAPPQDAKYKDGQVAPGGFAFDLLGVRVPAILISPWIPAGTVDSQIYDHSSLAASLRALFLPDTMPLTTREAGAATFLHNLSLAAPRLDGLPTFAAPSPLALTADATLEAAPDESDLDDFQQSLVWLTEKVAGELEAGGIPTAPSLEVLAADAQAQDVSPISSASLRVRQEQVSRILWRE
jgi:phospholipase C